MLQAAVWVGRHNADSKRIMLRLPDSSEAVLSPGATIRYRTDFGHYAKREVKVEGRAGFSVVRNEQSPFVVISEMVSTVVLGTVFEVEADKNSDEISVRLQSGKVLVKIDPIRDSGRQYMLKPGEEFVFVKANGSVVIRDFIHGPNVANRAGRTSGKPDSLFNWYMFNNQPLAEVLQQLSNLYNVDIDYNKEELQHIYFIGRLEKKDSLGETLRDIALLNHLKVTLRNSRTHHYKTESHNRCSQEFPGQDCRITPHAAKGFLFNNFKNKTMDNRLFAANQRQSYIFRFTTTAPICGCAAGVGASAGGGEMAADQ